MKPLANHVLRQRSVTNIYLSSQVILATTCVYLINQQFGKRDHKITAEINIGQYPEIVANIFFPLFPSDKTRRTWHSEKHKIKTKAN